MKKLAMGLCCLLLLGGCVTNAAPDGIVPEEIDVPEVVLEAAKTYVLTQYDYWKESSDVTYLSTEGKVVVREAPKYDNWKIDYIDFVYHYDDVEGYAFDVYLMNYWLHTTTPDKVSLAGGMKMEEDWVVPTYPDCTYLLFTVQEDGSLVYYESMMENDTVPGEDLFESDLVMRIHAENPSSE